MINDILVKMIMQFCSATRGCIDTLIFTEGSQNLYLSFSSNFGGDTNNYYSMCICNYTTWQKVCEMSLKLSVKLVLGTCEGEGCGCSCGKDSI